MRYLSIGEENILDINAACDKTKLYLYARGSQMKTSSKFYLDVDKNENTGYKTYLWTKSGSDYLVSDNVLYKYQGNGSDWNWVQIKTISMKKTNKAVASDGTTNTLSGWAEISQGAEYFNRAATPQSVMSKCYEIGHTLKTDIFDNGIPGQYNASHAEKQLSLLSNNALGVSKPMCLDCIECFKKLAKKLKVEKVVADPNVTRIFMADGITVIEIPH
jgi:hypothetical protein